MSWAHSLGATSRNSPLRFSGAFRGCKNLPGALERALREGLEGAAPQNLVFQKVPSTLPADGLAPRGYSCDFLGPQAGGKGSPEGQRTGRQQVPNSPACFPQSSSPTRPHLPTPHGATSTRQISEQISEPSTQPRLQPLQQRVCPGARLGFLIHHCAL